MSGDYGAKVVDKNVAPVCWYIIMWFICRVKGVIGSLCMCNTSPFVRVHVHIVYSPLSFFKHCTTWAICFENGFITQGFSYSGLLWQGWSQIRQASWWTRRLIFTYILHARTHAPQWAVLEKLVYFSRRDLQLWRIFALIALGFKVSLEILCCAHIKCCI